MSGGHFDYRDFCINEIADEIFEIIVDNNKPRKGDWDCNAGKGYQPKTIKEFKNAVKALRIAAIYAHRIDYLLSGDDGEESFLIRLKEDLKGVNK